MQKYIVVLLISLLLGLGTYTIHSDIEPQQLVYDEEVVVEMYRYEFNFTRNGNTSTDQITLYVGVDYLFNVTNNDTNHAMTVKSNSFTPQIGEYQSAVITFTEQDIGNLNYKCQNYCGTGHGGMDATIIVEAQPSTSESTVDTNLNTTTVTVTENVTQTESTVVTSQVVSNQTIIEKVEVTITLYEQVSFGLISLLSLLLLPLIRRRNR